METETFEKMTFEAYPDFNYDKAIGPPYKVKINPETFERSLTVTGPVDAKDSKKNNKSKENVGVGKETYSFDLVFDGTGVVDGMVGPDAVAEEFQAFLKVVYWRLVTKKENKDAVDESTPEDQIPQDQKLPNYVKLTYCKSTFRVMLDSMTVKYVLMHRNGKPLRIKASCRFSTAQKPTVNGTGQKKGSKSNSDSQKKTVQEDTDTKNCVCTCTCYDDTVKTAKENDSASLMSCDHSKEEMSGSNHAPGSGERNSMPADAG